MRRAVHDSTARVDEDRRLLFTCPACPIRVVRRGWSNGIIEASLLAEAFLPSFYPTYIPLTHTLNTMSLPDIVTNPDAVLGDDVAWRFKRAPDYSKTRKWYEASE